jgi:hypothetical protein
LANSFLYAVEGPGNVGANEVYLLLDNFTRTNSFTSNGAPVADFSFPILVAGVETNVTLHITTGPGQTFVETLTRDSDQANLGSFLTNGQIDAAVGFGKDHFLSNQASHEIIEVEVSLAIAQSGAWSGSASDNTVDPPIFSGIFTLNLDDSLTILPISTTAIQETGSSSMMGIGMAGLFYLARKARARLHR